VEAKYLKEYIENEYPLEVELIIHDAQSSIESVCVCQISSSKFKDKLLSNTSRMNSEAEQKVDENGST